MNPKNFLQLQGNVSTELTVRKSKDNKHANVSFSVAVEDSFATKQPDGTKKKGVQYIRCNQFLPNVDKENKHNLAYLMTLGKGDRVAILGQLETSTYKDDKGETKYASQVSVETLSATEVAEVRAKRAERRKQQANA